jgi:hypothetical protein
MTTPQFVEMRLHGVATAELVATNDIKRIVPAPEHGWVEMDLLSADGERLRVLVAGSYRGWCERLGVPVPAEVDGQALAAAVSRYEQEARA